MKRHWTRIFTTTRKQENRCDPIVTGGADPDTDAANGTGGCGTECPAFSAEADSQQLQSDNIIRISGLTGLSEQARNIAQQVLNSTAAPLGKQYDVVDRLSGRWAPVALQQRLSEQLDQLNEKQRDQLEALLENSQLQSVRDKELKAIAEQNSDSYHSYITRLRASPPAAARLTLIRQLDQAMQFSALMTVTRQQVYPQLEAVLDGWQPAADWQAGLQQDVIEFLLYVHRFHAQR